MPETWRTWTALGLVYVVWGSTYLAIVYVVDTLPPLLSASSRFAAAALLLATYLVVRRGRTAFAATRGQLARACVVGVLLLAGGNGGVTLAEDADLPSGLAALLVATVPLFVVVLRLLARDRPAGRTLLGVGVGFAGLAVLLLPGSRPQGVALGAALVVVASSLLWSVGSFAATRWSLPRDGLFTTVVEMAAGSVGLAVGGLLRGERLEPAQVQTSSVVALLYLVVFGSIVAFTAYSWLLATAPVSKVATYAYVNPVVAVLLGAAFVDEELTTTTVVGGGLTLVAVAVVVSEESRRRREVLEVPADAPACQDPEDRQGRLSSSAT